MKSYMGNQPVHDGIVHLSEVSMRHQGVSVVSLLGSLPIHCRITVLSFMHGQPNHNYWYRKPD